MYGKNDSNAGYRESSFMFFFFMYTMYIRFVIINNNKFWIEWVNMFRVIIDIISSVSIMSLSISFFDMKVSINMHMIVEIGMNRSASFIFKSFVVDNISG